MDDMFEVNVDMILWFERMEWRDKWRKWIRLMGMIEDRKIEIGLWVKVNVMLLVKKEIYIVLVRRIEGI